MLARAERLRRQFFRPIQSVSRVPSSCASELRVLPGGTTIIDAWAPLEREPAIPA